jgi:hypothetical protein
MRRVRETLRSVQSLQSSDNKSAVQPTTFQLFALFLTAIRNPNQKPAYRNAAWRLVPAMCIANQLSFSPIVITSVKLPIFQN